MGVNLSPNSRTSKILASKDGETRYLEEIVTWVAESLDDTKILIVPFPSTNIDKPFSKQLPYLVAKRLNELSPNWVDGSGTIYRKTTLPKNTRDEALQFESISLKPEKLKGFTNVLILDDVVTSGSSLKAGLRVLSPFKLKVTALAIARKVHLTEIPKSGIY